MKKKRVSPVVEFQTARLGRAEKEFEIHYRVKGSVLILAILVLGLMVFLAAYFISFGLTGAGMAHNQKFASQSYYLAEAGVEEAIFKLKNDTVWKSAFETLSTPSDLNCSSWSISPYQRSSALFSNGSYYITINNLGCAKAEIVSLALLDMGGGKKAQRVVKVKVFKAVGSTISDYGIFTGGPSENIDITFTSPLRVHNGNFFVNNNLQVKFFSNVTIDKKALAGGNVNIDGSSQLNSTSTCSKNMCQSKCNAAVECPPAPKEMPPLDFDSDDPNSFLSRAKASDCGSLRHDGKINCVFTPAEFESALWQNYPIIVFSTSSFVYVTGDVNIRAGQNVTVIGALVAERDISLGESFCWSRSEPPYLRCGNATVKVIRPGTPDDNLPSGLFAERKFSSGGFLGIGTASLDVHGIIHSGDELKISSVLAPIRVEGAIAARKISLSSIWQNFDVYLDSDVIADTFIGTSYAPMITVDHWEEEY
ncbi:MAG: hypothetical protein PHW31_00625 [Candidatus Pacebacteria bacterium]|nr:hypothetical protein [Candidatus Paceibacterota bacterium]